MRISRAALTALLTLAWCLVAQPSAAQRDIQATSVVFPQGPCTVTSNSDPAVVLKSGCTTIRTDGGADLTLKPDDDLWLTPDDVLTMNPGSGRVDVDGFIGTPTFASKTTGWRCDVLGNCDMRDLQVDTLRAEMFEIDKTSVLAGSQYITKGHGRISQTFTCPAAGGTATLWVEDDTTYGDAAVYISGDTVKVRLESRTAMGPFTISECIGVVTSYSDGSGGNAGQQSWTFTRNASTNGGGMSNGTTVPAGLPAIDFGTTGNGYIESTALDGANNINAPWVQIPTWATSPIGANTTVRCRMGNLRGMTGVTGEYGIFCGDIQGSLATTKAVKASSEGVDIYNASLSLYSGTDVTFKVDPTVPSLAIGATLPTGFSTGTGFWCGIDSGTFKCRIGNPSGNRYEFNGTSSSFYGDGGGVTNINGGNIQTNTIDVGSINATGFGDNVIKNCCFEGSSLTSQASAWAMTSARNSGTAPAVTTSVGTVGPGVMILAPGNGSFSEVMYRAVPVRPGDTYAVSVDTYSSNTTAGGINVFLLESTSSASTVRYVMVSSSSSPDVNLTGFTSCYSGGATGGSFATRSCTYTVPSGVNWVSLNIQDTTGSLVGTTYTEVGIDNAKMRLQLGAGDIKANSLTALQIAAGTITANEIAVGGITADRISASTLDAISANLGTITSGEVHLGGGCGSGGLDIADDLICAGTMSANSIGTGQVDTNGLEATGSVFFPNLPGSGNYVCFGAFGQMTRGTSCP